MAKFDVEEVMAELRERIIKEQMRPGNLQYATYYYRRMIQRLSEKKELVIFGAGKYGQGVLDVLRLERIGTIACFCDNNDKMIGTCIQGVEVLSLHEATKRYADACYIVTPIDYENEILQQLLCAGIKSENIVIYNTRNTGMVIG